MSQTILAALPRKNEENDMGTSIINGAKVTAEVFAVVTANITIVAMLVYPAMVAAGYGL